MAQKTINDLDAATTPLDGTEEIELEQSSASKKATIQDVVDLAQGIDGGTTDNLVSIDSDDALEDSGVAKADVTAAKNHADGDGSDHADVATNTSHRASTSNPHSVDADDVDLGTTDDVEFQSLQLNGDNDADDVAYVRPIVFLTEGDGDPTWSNYPEGTIFIWKEGET